MNEKGINKSLSEKNMIEVIIVEKNKFTEFIKGKGYYVLLFVGVIAIAAVAIVGSQLSPEKQSEGEDYVDLNEVNDNIDDQGEDIELTENDPVSEGIANNADNSSEDTVANENAGQEVANNEDLIEYEGYAEDITKDKEQTQQTEVAAAETEEEIPEAVETTGTTVEADASPTMNNLSFKEADGLLWPVNGNVIMDYSMDHTVYFATLMQYRTNPAMILDAEVGTEVKAAADGIVTAIETDNEETGLTVTMNIGDGYSVIYGQLDNVSLEVGDSISEGEVIGTINEPTKYYSVEGSNLYFMVLEDDQSLNPMLFLRSNQGE